MAQLLRPDTMIAATGWSSGDISKYNDNSDSTYGYEQSSTNYLRMGFPMPPKVPTSGNTTIYLRLSRMSTSQSVTVKIQQGATVIDSRVITLTTTWPSWGTQSFSVALYDYSDIRVYLESATADVALADIWIEVPDGATNGLEMGCSF